MYYRIVRILVVYCIMQIIVIPVLSQNTVISFRTDFLLGRFDEPTQTKFSPNWDMVKKSVIPDFIPPPRNSFPRLSNNPRSNSKQWKDITFVFIKSFLTEPHNYGDFAKKDEEIFPYLISYGILGNGNYAGEYDRDHKERIDSLFTFFTADRNMVDLLGYLKPAATLTLKCMSETTKSGYKTVLAEAVKYVVSLKDENYYNQELEYCKKKQGFSYKDANGIDDPFRKIKSFVFRRYTDFKAKTWSKTQSDEFQKSTGYRPKPNWGMNLASIEKYCKLVDTWFLM